MDSLHVLQAGVCVTQIYLWLGRRAKYKDDTKGTQFSVSSAESAGPQPQLAMIGVCVCVCVNVNFCL